MSYLLFIQVSDDSEKVDYTAAAFHPDGLILGTGTSQSVVKIWDVKSQVKILAFRTILLLEIINFFPIFFILFSFFRWIIDKCGEV